MRHPWIIAVVALAAGCAEEPPVERVRAALAPAPGDGACSTCGCSQACTPGNDDCPPGSCCARLNDDEAADEYECVVPRCLADADCPGGMACAIGSSCDENRCMCANGEPPSADDPEHPCCEMRNRNGVCCDTGEVDEETGLCVCTEPMEDGGDGCACPRLMRADEEDVCVCADPEMVFEPELESCVCAEGQEVHDAYTGTVECRGPGDPPPECWDRAAVFDEADGQCRCPEGTTLRFLEGYATASCVRLGCGDDVCDKDESCDECPDDCPCHDAGVGQSPADAGGPGAVDAGAPGAVDADPWGAVDAGLPFVVDVVNGLFQAFVSTAEEPEE